MEERVGTGRRVLVGPADRAREYQIEDVRFHQGRPVVRFVGVGTMNEAETLAGSELWLRQVEIDPLPAGTVFRHDLVGCEVRGTTGGTLGRVTGGEGSLDRSHPFVDEHMMIPLVADICVGIDIANRRVTIDPPDGLIDLNRPAGRSQ